jgi:hypothetical protein
MSIIGWGTYTLAAFLVSKNRHFYYMWGHSFEQIFIHFHSLGNSGQFSAEMWRDLRV